MTGDHVASLDISMSFLKSKWPLEKFSNLSPQLQNLLQGILPDMGRKCCASSELDHVPEKQLLSKEGVATAQTHSGSNDILHPNSDDAQWLKCGTDNPDSKNVMICMQCMRLNVKLSTLSVCIFSFF